MKFFQTNKTLRTLRAIRYQTQKQTFFQHLIKRMSEEFTQSDYTFLVDYIFPQKYQNKISQNNQEQHLLGKQYFGLQNQKRSSIERMHIEELVSNKQTNKIMRLNSQNLSLHRSSFFKISQTTKMTNQGKTKQEHIRFTDCKEYKSNNSKKKFKIKFNRIINQDSPKMEMRNLCSLKQRVKFKRQNDKEIISSEKIKNIYSNDLIRSIFSGENNIKRKATDYQFQDSFIITASPLNKTDYWNKGIQKQNQIKNLKSFGIEKEKSIAGFKICRRKY